MPIIEVNVAEDLTEKRREPQDWLPKEVAPEQSKMVRRCTGCNRIVPKGEEKCCNRFFDSSIDYYRTGRRKMPKKARILLRRAGLEANAK